MRGQSTIEYLINLTVIILGVATVFAAPQLVERLEQLYHLVVVRVGADAVYLSEDI